jgi:signal transduction histidine kinase
MFSAREFQILNGCIDEGIATAIQSFEETRTADRKDMTEQLGFIVHEIRNAVGNASLGFELIRRGKAGMQGSTADVVHRSLARIASLVAGSLAEIRVREGTVQREWVRISSLFLKVIEETPPERGIQIRSEVADDLFMDVDERLLASALNNLLQNAVKFTRNDQPIVLRALSADRSVLMEVEDRCGGLPEGETERLFQPFVQGENNTRGAGLGLAIARRAVEAHGGTIEVRNLPGRGCIFSISLPQTTSVGL